MVHIAKTAHREKRMKQPMTQAEHDSIIKMARQAKLPRYMYDTPAAREALKRFADLLALQSHLVP